MRTMIVVAVVLLCCGLVASAQDKAGVIRFGDRDGEDMLAHECKQRSLAKDGMRCKFQFSIEVEPALLVYVSRPQTDPKWADTKYQLQRLWRSFQQIGGHMMVLRQPAKDGAIWQTANCAGWARNICPPSTQIDPAKDKKRDWWTDMVADAK